MINLFEIAADTLFQLCQPCLKLAVGEVLVPVINRLEIAAIDGDGFTEEVELAAKNDKLTADSADRLSVVLADVGNRLEVRRQPTTEPDQSEVALGFPLQAAARLDAVEIAVNVEIDERCRVVTRAASGLRFGSVESLGR